jgi:hypothetical protein
MYEKQMAAQSIQQSIGSIQQAQYAASMPPPPVEDTVTSLGNALSSSVERLHEYLEALERDLSPVCVSSPVPTAGCTDAMAPSAVVMMRLLISRVNDAGEVVMRLRNGLRV